MCGRCPGCLATLCNRTHSLISPLQNECMSVPVRTQTHTHTHTRVRPPRQVGEPWEGHFMFPDSPVRPQWRPSNTHAAAITHRAYVYVCMRTHLSANLPPLRNVCGQGSDSSLCILPTTDSNTFNLVNPAKWLQCNIRRFAFATWQAAVMTPLLSPVPQQSQNLSLGFVAVFLWLEHVMWPPQLCSLQTFTQPWWKLRGTN